jgi:hypothetical protein
MGAISQGLATNVAFRVHSGTMFRGFRRLPYVLTTPRRLPPIGPAPGWRQTVIMLAAASCAAFALAGCAGGTDSVTGGSFWAQPGKYDFLKCPDLAKQSMAESTREKELVSLMERANQSSAGPVVNFMVYDADLQQARANLALLQKTSREKGCDNLVPATATRGGRPK